MTEMKTVDDISEEEYLREHMVPHSLTPSPEGRECLCNGSWVGYECCCDECDHYLVCFPNGGVSMKCKTSLPLILTAKQMDTVEATMSPERLTIAKIVREGLCGKDDYFWAESPNE